MHLFSCLTGKLNKLTGKLYISLTHSTLVLATVRGTISQAKKPSVRVLLSTPVLVTTVLCSFIKRIWRKCKNLWMRAFKLLYIFFHSSNKKRSYYIQYSSLNSKITTKWEYRTSNLRPLPQTTKIKYKDCKDFVGLSDGANGAARFFLRLLFV